MNPNPHPLEPESDLEALRRGFGPVYRVEPAAPKGQRMQPIPGPGDEMHVPPEVAQATAQVAAMTRNPFLIDHAQESAWRAYKAMQLPAGCDQQGRLATRSDAILDRPAGTIESWELDDYEADQAWSAIDYLCALVSAVVVIGACVMVFAPDGWFQGAP
jgi:hypothetical protein